VAHCGFLIDGLNGVSGATKLNEYTGLKQVV
jgi:hypothetical protein